jgi:hypothetical protein
MKILVQFLSSGYRVYSDIFGKETICSNKTAIQIHEGITIRVGQLELWESVGAQPYEFYIEIAKGVAKDIAVALIVKWIFEKLSKKTTKITIDGVEVKMDEREIESAMIKVTTKNRDINITVDKNKGKK